MSRDHPECEDRKRVQILLHSSCCCSQVRYISGHQITLLKSAHFITTVTSLVAAVFLKWATISVEILCEFVLEEIKLFLVYVIWRPYRAEAMVAKYHIYRNRQLRDMLRWCRSISTSWWYTEGKSLLDPYKGCSTSPPTMIPSILLSELFKTDQITLPGGFEWRFCCSNSEVLQ
jgi:hypothetical protein